jgi:lipid-A-disaccharide synthase
MVNLIAGKKVVPEFLQKDATEKNIAAALSPLLESSHKRRAMLSGYNEIRRSLGIPGVYLRAADLILKKTSHG